MRRLSANAWLLLALTAGCEDRSYREIGGEITLLCKRTDALVAPARQRLAKFGRRAIPQIETALHTASQEGKLNLIAALGTVHDAEAIPILRHFAVYDAGAAVRTACEGMLKSWAVGAGALGETSRTALARITKKREAGEGPLGTPPPMAGTR